ncbi:MAG TPA: TetR/AcrR family transcriptional regulator [Stellaceae bacterium]|jgi:AcrR family transcriptional regulator
MEVKEKPTRRYNSSLRDAQSAQTRERIMMAAKEFLETNNLEDLTLRQIAELADISAPTVYAYFPTMDALHQAFFFWLKPQIGTDLGLPAFADLASVPKRMFPYYVRQGRLLRNLMDTPAWDRLRATDWQAKQEAWAQAIRAALPELTATQTARGAIAIHAFSTPNMWRWLVDITGCPEEDAEQIASWAIATLTAALHRDASGLARANSGAPRKTMSRMKGTDK